MDAPHWRRRATPRPRPLGWSKPRPQSYQSPSGLLVTDFPVEDRCALGVSRPAMAALPNGTARPPPDLAPDLVPHSPVGSTARGTVPAAGSGQGRGALSPRAGGPAPHRDRAVIAASAQPAACGRAGEPPGGRGTSPAGPGTSPGGLGASPGIGRASEPPGGPGTAPGVIRAAASSGRPGASPRTSRAAENPGGPGTSPGIGRAAQPPGGPGTSPGGPRTPPGTGRAAEHPQGSPGTGRVAESPLVPQTSPEAAEPPQGSPGGAPAEPPALLSTHSPAALRLGSQQLIPLGLAEGPRGSGAARERPLKARSLVEPPRPPPGSDPEPEPDPSGSPGALRRGLRSTSYRRAVGSAPDTDGANGCKKKNRMSQPILRAVAEDKEKFSSLGRIKKMLKGQGTFDGEENAVLYQNYKEKALDIDSDEECEPREQKWDEKVVFQHKPLRSTWSQLSVVKRNGLSEAVSQEERKRQEAIFEVISSEHSYLLSLEILLRMFKNSKELSLTMTKTESHHLFSNITDVYEASKKFFEELEARHQNNICIDDISDIVERHAGSSFDPYVKYCSNEVYQQRTLQRLLATNPAFKEVLSRIEAHKDCRNLPMISFLILPMQRVTRLPLLMDTICQKTPKDSAKYENCKQALKEVSKLVRLCNEGARKMERTEMMYTINSQLEFKIKPFPLVSSSRWLVKRGELTAYVEDTGLFSKRTSKQQVYFFLFNDVLIITKKKSEESYNVTEYALREQLLVLPCDGDDGSATPCPGRGAAHAGRAPAPHLFRLLVLSNHAGDRVEMLLGTDTQSDRARWVTALGQDSNGHHTDRTTLAQVEIIRTYTAKQADELSLQVADVVLVYQKVADGSLTQVWLDQSSLQLPAVPWVLQLCSS
ncbi:rho guanine nucleotide exchange factor 26 isoform X2 [Pithys albifrons albifrons]|uniref:rho guanine nucleotide exchange factor 26 isoform X2 n=1 Tax=Pithys albifrons albifrons TaxID=3385563 RepID=UPI003A5CCEE2